MLRAKFEEQKQKAFDLNQGAAQYAILKHEVETTQDLYQTLQLKLKQAGIVAGLASANIGVVEPGQMPSEPVDPRPVLDLALGLGCGLVLGMLSGCWAGGAGYDSSHPRDRSGRASSRPGGDPTESVARSQSAAKAFFRAAQSFRFAPDRPPSAAIPGGRVLSQPADLPCCCHPGPGPRRSLVITSSLPRRQDLDRGKLRHVLAQQGAKVLLVDTDFRQPSLHPAFEIPQEPGLSEVLSGACPARAQSQPSDMLPNLSLLPSGAPSLIPQRCWRRPDAELLEDWRSLTITSFSILPRPRCSPMRSCWAHMPTPFCWWRARRNHAYALRHARDLLLRANANIAGVVLNGMDRRYARSYYRPYGYGFRRKEVGVLDS